MFTCTSSFVLAVLLLFLTSTFRRYNALHNCWRDRIIRLEDVLEALLQEEIYDEMDAAGRMPIAEELEPSVENPESYRLAY